MGSSRKSLPSLGVIWTKEVRYLWSLTCSNFRSPKPGKKSLPQCGCSAFLSIHCALTHPSKSGLNWFFMWCEPKKAPFGVLTEEPNTVLRRINSDAMLKTRTSEIRTVSRSDTSVHECGRQSAGHGEVFIHCIKLLTLMTIELCKQKPVSVWEALLKAAQLLKQTKEGVNLERENKISILWFTLISEQSHGCLSRNNTRN